MSADFVSYPEFGRRFLEFAASEERILATFSRLTGAAFDLGPIGVGPGRLAKVTAEVQLGRSRLHRLDGELICFEQIIPLELDLLLDVAVDRHRFHVEGTVHLHLTVRTAAPLRVVIEIAEPRPADVRVDVAAATRRGQWLRVLAGVDHEVRRFVARYISTEIRRPDVAAACDIDVARRLDQAWQL
ncbi:hypothetical protein [Nocardia sp. R6R-6]|uniref:hypothetical protein n=1 Tax=Nocardia sp. R6R-6 TaxID=3459303 RepID=UPI00403E111A